MPCVCLRWWLTGHDHLLSTHQHHPFNVLFSLKIQIKNVASEKCEEVVQLVCVSKVCVHCVTDVSCAHSSEMLGWALPESCKRACKCKSTYIDLNVFASHIFVFFLLTYFNFFLPLTFKYWKHVFELWEDADVPGEHCCVSEMFLHPLDAGERGLCCCQLHRGWKWTNELDMRIQRRPELGTSTVRRHRFAGFTYTGAEF